MYNTGKVKTDKTCNLKLTGVVNSWECFTRRKSSPRYLSVRLVVGDKNDHRCKYCHYQGEHLEVINLDHNYKNNDINNLSLCCSLCLKPLLLDSYDMNYEGEDRMIYFPGLSQSDLSVLYRVILYSLAKGGDDAYNAKILYSQLKDQAAFLDEKVGSQLSHPSQFVHYMNSKGADLDLVNKIRWLPSLELSNYSDEIKDISDDFDVILDSHRKKLEKIARTKGNKATDEKLFSKV